MEHPLPSPYYRVSVKAIIKDDQDRLLVVEGKNHKWELPGGGWEHHETMEDCVHREVVEELGVRPATVGDVLFSIRGQHASGTWKLSLLVEVTLPNNDVTVTGEEDLLQAVFVSRQDLPKLQFTGDERAILEHLDEVWPPAGPPA